MAGDKPDKGRYKRYIIAEDRGKEQKIPRSSEYFRKSKKEKDSSSDSCSNAEQLNDSDAEQLNDSNAEQLNDSDAEQLNDSDAEQLNDSDAEQLNDSDAEQLNYSDAEQLNDSDAEQVNASHSDGENEIGHDYTNYYVEEEFVIEIEGDASDIPPLNQPDLPDQSTSVFQEDDVQDINADAVVDGDSPLYPGATLTKAQSILLHTMFMIRHGLTQAALKDYLTLFNAHHPDMAPTTRYLFQKTFGDTEKAVVYLYCDNCNGHLGIESALDDNITCPLCSFECRKKENLKKGCYFLTLDLRKQIKFLLETNSLMKGSGQEGTISDIMDGELYRQKVAPGHISLMWNTDGVAIFKSANYSIWPIQCMLVELGPKLRREKVILGGLWFGPRKPNMNNFLKPFVEQCQSLHDEGVTFVKPGQNVEHTYFVQVLISVCDAPARAECRNATYFNGQFGCDFCLHPGEVIERGQGHARVYPPDNEVGFADRSVELHMLHVREALEKNSPCKGIKGPSVLSLLPGFDIVDGFVPDYMHSVLLGVVRHFVMDVWFDSVYHEKPFYLLPHVDKINERLSSIQVPHEITRTPRRIDSRKFWKASEWRAFVLFYSIPVVHGVLPDCYLRHWFLLVFAVHQLLQSTVTEAQVKAACLALQKFVDGVEDLYGREHLSYNVHLLLHLGNAVKNWGPLWATSAFSFEGNNGLLKKLAHGTREIPKQICSRFTMWTEVLTRLNFFNRNNASVEFLNTCNQIMNNQRFNLQKATRFPGDVVALGAGKNKIVSANEALALQNLGLNIRHGEKVTAFSKFIVNHTLLQVSEMGSVAHNDSCIQLDDAIFGYVQSLVSIKNCVCAEKCECVQQPVLLLKKETVHKGTIRDRYSSADCNFLHIAKVGNVQRLIALPPNHKWRKCCCFVINETKFISPLPNLYERD